MPYEVRGVVARSKGAPVTIETILVPDPGPGEAVVDIQACGVCHTDLHYREGGINDDFPFLLGHEAAGVVSAVGEGVTNVAVGDYVILNWRAVCGQCRACAKGQGQYCFDTHNAAQKMTLLDGTELSPALGIGAFIEKTLVHSGQCTKVDPAAPPAAAGLLGCGVMAGVGAAMNTGAVARGESVAVFGCGGVGDAAIAGAKLAGAARSSPPGTATASPAATSRCSSTCTCRAASPWTTSSPRRSGSTTSMRPSTRCTPATCCARWSSSDDPEGREGCRQRRLQPRR